MLDIEKWQKLGSFVAKNWLAVIIGATLGIGGTVALYERFVVQPRAVAQPSTPRDVSNVTNDPLTDEEKAVADTFRVNKNSSHLVLELALAIFERSEDGTPGSYYVMADLCGLIDQPTILADVDAGGDVSILRRFIASVARHQKTYQSTSYRRPQDPGFYRHFVLATAFHKVSASLDAAEADGQSAREWALVFYARFLGNINAQMLTEGRYSGTVSEAVNQAKVRARVLSRELFIRDRSIGSTLERAISEGRFNTILDSVRGTWSERRSLEEILGKTALESDSLWLK